MEILVGRQHGAPNSSMRHFVVAPGGHTPHHKHDYEHEVVVLEGEADVQYGPQVQRVRAGDVLYIAPNQMHQFRNAGTGPMRFLCPGAHLLRLRQADAGVVTRGGCTASRLQRHAVRAQHATKRK